MNNKFKIVMPFIIIMIALLMILIPGNCNLFAFCRNNSSKAGQVNKNFKDKYYGKYTTEQLKEFCYRQDTIGKTILEIGYWKPIDSSIVLITQIPDNNGDYSEICLLKVKNNKLNMVARGDFEEKLFDSYNKSNFTFLCNNSFLDTTEYNYVEGKNAIAFNQCFPGSINGPLFHNDNMFHYLYLFQVKATKISLMGVFIQDSFDENFTSDSTNEDSIKHYTSDIDTSKLSFSKSTTNGYYDINLFNIIYNENDSLKTITKSKTIYKWDNEYYQKAEDIVISRDTVYNSKKYIKNKPK